MVIILGLAIIICTTIICVTDAVFDYLKEISKKEE